MEDYKIDLSNGIFRDAALEKGNLDEAVYVLGKAGGGVEIFPAEKLLSYRYLIGCVEVLESHAAALELRFYRENESYRRLGYIFGVLPGVKTLICLDLELIDSRTIFTSRTPAMLKMVIHGNRMEPNEVSRVEFGMKNCFHDVCLSLSDFRLSENPPSEYPAQTEILVDEFGQWTKSDWPGKIKSERELRKTLEDNLGKAGYPFEEWDKWGGSSLNKLAEGTGYFGTIKTDDGRWHLVDPDGNEFFSIGSDCVNCGEFTRLDPFTDNCAVLPSRRDPLYEDCYMERKMQRSAHMPSEHLVAVNYTKAHLKRTFGDSYFEKWREISENILMGSGFNTIGNWSSPVFGEKDKRIPYVFQIRDFPTTSTLIFRDFPDVLSEEYRKNAELYAQGLMEKAGDPWMIGYFMRNEPEFAFVPKLLIADEVLRNPVDSACREGIIEWLKEKYKAVEELNKEWGSDFESFDALEAPIPKCAETWPASKQDLSELSVMLIRAYVSIPAMACRAVDSNHLNLGMRWAQVDTKEQLAGWEYFDVFSINSYTFSPWEVLDFIAASGVDKPIMIGEFHFGALDRGLPSTGLKAVTNQVERGKAFSYYIEHCAAHPNAVGAHWFQFNDQGCLGRFDGENYQIGLVDVCMQPYHEILDAARESAGVIYGVKNGRCKPFCEEPKVIPMIAY